MIAEVHASRPKLRAHAAVEVLTEEPRCACARCSTSFLSICITAQAHLVMLMVLQVLPIIPIVQPKATLPRFGHAQIVLTAQALPQGCWQPLASPSRPARGPPESTTEDRPATVITQQDEALVPRRRTIIARRRLSSAPVRSRSCVRGVPHRGLR